MMRGKVVGILWCGLIAATVAHGATIMHVRADSTQVLDYGLLKQGTFMEAQGTATNGTIGATGSGLFSLQVALNSAFFPAQSVYAFCAEPAQSISGSSLPTTFLSGTLTEAGLNATQQALLMTLWHHAFAMATATSSSEGTPAVRAAAFQWLAWDILGDATSNGGVIDLTSGSVRLDTTATGNTASVRTLATTWGSNINNGTWTSATRDLRILQNSSLQNLIYENPGSSVPEPPTMAIAGLALIVISYVGRKHGRMSL